MSRRITDLRAVLDRAATIEHGMFRLETLQTYDVGYEAAAMEGYLRTGAVDLSPGPWQVMIRDHVRAGRSCRRVHVVREPLSDYLRYEIAVPYARSVAAGEQIRLLPAGRGRWPDGIPEYDFWIFDDELWVMRYDGLGRFVEVDVDLDAGSVAEHRRAAQVAFVAATAAGGEGFGDRG